MAEIVCCVLNLTIGFLADKLRDEVLERLKDGDVTDEECRRLIVKELEDIKGKLDGLARKDLLSSLCFLQEGVEGLYQSLLLFESNEKRGEESSEHAKLTAEDASPRRNSVGEAITLINSISSLNISSNERFKSALESLKLAREKATEAFCNESLSAEDRIQATQVRIIARILEKLEDPNASLTNCLMYLKQLHDIGAVQEIFSVLRHGGMKLRFNQTKRLSNASSVHIMNQLLFDFARKFTNFRPAICEWPLIQIGKLGIYHPIFGEYRVLEKLQAQGSAVKVMAPYPNYKFDDSISPGLSAVNSKREIVAKIIGRNTIKIFKPSGESRTLCEITKESHASEYHIVDMDIDAEDNLYVIAAFQGWNDRSWNFLLCIFDQNGKKKLGSLLSFLQNSSWQKVRIAVNKDGKRIAILNYDAKILYVGNVSAQQNSFRSFKVKNELSPDVHGNIRCSDFNGTKIISSDMMAVYIYTENGVLDHKIQIPEGHGCIASVAIDHIEQRILVMTSRVADCYNLFSFSETGELIGNLCLGHSGWFGYNQLASHRNGAVALVCKQRAALLQQYID